MPPRAPAAAGPGGPATVLLPEWLEPPAIPGLTFAWYDSGDPVPGQDVLDAVELFVPPYMCDLDTVALAGRMPRLRVVQALMAGVDGWAGVVGEGVQVRRAVGVHDDSTAELAVGLAIAMQRGVDVAARDMAQGKWRHEHRPALADSAVGVVGWGGVGRAIARRLEPFAVTLHGFASTAHDGAHAVTELDRFLPELDIVILASPLTPATRHLVDARRLGLMRPGALLVNVGRGPLVDTDALVEALRTGRVRAALDVTDPEPLPPDHPLWRCPGALVTPHVGGDSEAFEPRARRMVHDALREFAAGLPRGDRTPETAG